MTEAPFHYDPERLIEDKSLGLICRIYGQAPVQADGRINQHPFYFRARHAVWEFTVCVSHDIDASAIWPIDDMAGFFTSGEYRGFHSSGDYGRDSDASLMRYDKAEEIIRRCVEQFRGAADGAGHSSLNG